MNKKFLILTLSALCAGSLLNAARKDTSTKKKIASVNIINKSDGNISGKVTFAVQSEGKNGKMTYSDKATQSFDFTDAKKKSMIVKADKPGQRLHAFSVKRANGKSQTANVPEYGQKTLTRTITVFDDKIRIGRKTFELAD